MQALPKLSGESMIKTATNLLGAPPTQGAPKPWDAVIVPKDGLTLGLGAEQPHVIFTAVNSDTVHVSLRDADGLQVEHWVEKRPG